MIAEPAAGGAVSHLEWDAVGTVSPGEHFGAPVKLSIRQLVSALSLILDGNQEELPLACAQARSLVSTH